MVFKWHQCFVKATSLCKNASQRIQALLDFKIQKVKSAQARKRINYLCESGIQKSIPWHARIQEFSSGGGPGQPDKKIALTFFFLLF